MGISEELNPCTSYSVSCAMMESIVMHIVDPDDTSIQLSNHMLNSVAKFSPNKSYECHAQISRFLIIYEEKKKKDLYNMYLKIHLWSEKGFFFFFLYLFDPLPLFILSFFIYLNFEIRMLMGDQLADRLKISYSFKYKMINSLVIWIFRIISNLARIRVFQAPMIRAQQMFYTQVITNYQNKKTGEFYKIKTLSKSIKILSSSSFF